MSLFMSIPVGRFSRLSRELVEEMLARKVSGAERSGAVWRFVYRLGEGRPPGPRHPSCLPSFHLFVSSHLQGF